MNTLAILTLLCGALSLLSLLLLHVVSPEFKPGWRMISEYALGKHKWLITSFFYFWGLSSLCLFLLLTQVVSGILAWTGLLLLLISALGEVMGGLFDVKHKYHGLAFALGVPALPIASLLISYTLLKQSGWDQHRVSILFSAHACWISLVLMALSMVLFFSGLKKAGIPMNKDSKPLELLPKGVVGINGYINRLLVFCYELWLMVVATCYLIL